MKWTTTTRSRKTARNTSTSARTSILAALTVLGLLVFMASPALAHHKDGHTQGPNNEAGGVSDHDGDADSSSETAYTEDNDTGDYDDGRADEANNISDDGDNAHPSGKDRSVENGGSGIQGRSESNPDDSKGPMRYEGALGDDKPNGTGGTDRADQDGNNGCGNDDDFDDDNNGWCGKPKTAPELAPEVIVTPAVPELEVEEDDEVEADIIGRTDNAGPKDVVLGTLIRNATPEVAAAPAAVKGAVLPFTGAGDIYSALMIGLLLIAAGMITMKLRLS